MTQVNHPTSFFWRVPVYVLPTFDTQDRIISDLHRPFRGPVRRGRRRWANDRKHVKDEWGVERKRRRTRRKTTTITKTSIPLSLENFLPTPPLAYPSVNPNFWLKATCWIEGEVGGLPDYNQPKLSSRNCVF